MSITRYRGDILVEEWNAATGLYRRYNSLGYAVAQRPLTDAELARVQQYDRASAKADAVDQAQQTVDGLQADTPTIQQQITADITTVQAGWASLDAATQTAILLRILGGFTTVMDGLQAHAAVTGAIDPLDTP
jgi:Tfp pilus assembly protein PilW